MATTDFICKKCSFPLSLPGSYGDVSYHRITCPNCRAVNVISRKGDRITDQDLDIFSS